MKNLKKFASIMLTLVMLVSMATTAFAANVTLPSEGILKDHTKKAEFCLTFSGAMTLIPLRFWRH